MHDERTPGPADADVRSQAAVLDLLVGSDGVLWSDDEVARTALDLAGETFAIALERRAQFRGDTPEQEQGWLFAIAHSQLLRFWKRGEVERAALQRLGCDPPEATSVDIE